MNPTLRIGTTALALTLLAGAPGASPQGPPSPAPTFPSGVELVIVDVVVLGGKGNPVAGLDQQDFTVLEDGVPQAITSFEAIGLEESEPVPPPARSRVSTNVGPAPRPEQSFMVVFDDANLSAPNADRAREAVRWFLEAGLRAGDQVTIVPTAGGAWWTGRLPEDRGDLEAFLARLQPRWVPESGGGRISDYEAMQIHFGFDRQVLSQVARRWYENGLLQQLPGVADRAETETSPGLPLIKAKAEDLYTQSTHRLRATLDTLERVAASLSGLRGRKTVLLVSEGFVHDATQAEFRDLVRAARTANAAVYFIDARGLQGTLGKGGLPGGGAEFMNPVEERDTLGVLGSASLEADGARSVAYDTGGSVISNTNQLAPAMKRIAEESRSYYLVGYVPANGKRDGRFRKIEVRVRKPQVAVRARRGYFAASADERTTRKKDEMDPSLRSALDAPYGGGAIPLRLTSYVFGAGADGKASVLLAAEADVSALGLRQGSDGRYTDVLESYVVVASRDTGERFSQEKLMELSLPPDVKARMELGGFPIFRDFKLPAGAYQARLLVRDRENGRTGTVRHGFTVEEPGAFRASTPILTDVARADAPGAPPRPVPIARAQFKPGSRLFCTYEIYGAAKDPSTGSPRVSAGWAVRRSDGSSFAAQDQRPVSPGPQGQISQLLAVGLQGAVPGEYDLVLTVRDDVAGKTLEVREPFAVVG